MFPDNFENGKKIRWKTTAEGALPSTGSNKMKRKTGKITKEKILAINIGKILKISKSFFRIHEEISDFSKKTLGGSVELNVRKFW